MVRWLPGHKGITDNEKAGELVRKRSDTAAGRVKNLSWSVTEQWLDRTLNSDRAKQVFKNMNNYQEN